MFCPLTGGGDVKVKEGSSHQTQVPSSGPQAPHLGNGYVGASTWAPPSSVLTLAPSSFRSQHKCRSSERPALPTLPGPVQQMSQTSLFSPCSHLPLLLRCAPCGAGTVSQLGQDRPALWNEVVRERIEEKPPSSASTWWPPCPQKGLLLLNPGWVFCPHPPCSSGRPGEKTDEMA